MPQIVKIEKEGNLKTDKVKDETELYKKCGFRKTEGFEKITDWKNKIDGEDVNIELWGRTNGKGAVKNNYEFPTIVNKSIYGNCSLIGKTNDKFIDLDKIIWDKMCNSLTNKMDNMEIQENLKEVKNELENISVVQQDDGKSGNESEGESESDSDNDSDSDGDESFSDSELKEESYIFSSEEAIG